MIEKKPKKPKKFQKRKLREARMRRKLGALITMSKRNHKAAQKIVKRWSERSRQRSSSKHDEEAEE